MVTDFFTSQVENKTWTCAVIILIYHSTAISRRHYKARKGKKIHVIGKEEIKLSICGLHNCICSGW